jgi:hypothetical protein
VDILRFGNFSPKNFSKILTNSKEEIIMTSKDFKESAGGGGMPW